MDYIKWINCFEQISCVLSAKEDGNGGYDVAIEAANDAYLKSVNKADEQFVPGRSYTEYVGTDPNFESMVIRCITTDKIVHHYINAELYNAWLDVYMLPVKSELPGKKLCLFTYEMTKNAESEKLADISSETALHVLRTCLRLRETDDFKSAMDSVVADIRKQCDASGCCVFLTDFDERKCEILSIDHDESFPLTPENDVFANKDFFSVVEAWRNLMAKSNCLIIADEKDYKNVEEKAPIWARSLRVSGVKNIVLFPLRLSEKTIGYIWAVNYNSDKIVIIRETMELNAFILSAEIASHQMYEKMELMSKVDLLTGVRSRNAMNNRIADILSGESKEDGSMGVMFVDVNGLKRVNDTEGHHAGDRLLKYVAERLKEIFADHEIYRAGGDEFLILLPGSTKEEFDGLLKEVRSYSDLPDKPNFAVGGCHVDDLKNIRKAMKLADEDMYKDKIAYYERHPEFDRRSR